MRCDTNSHAAVAELADALDLGSSVPDVKVQVLSAAPIKTVLPNGKAVFLFVRRNGRRTVGEIRETPRSQTAAMTDWKVELCTGAERVAVLSAAPPKKERYTRSFLVFVHNPLYNFIFFYKIITLTKRHCL